MKISGARAGRCGSEAWRRSSCRIRAIVDEESALGMISAAAAILDDDGQPAGAVNSPVPKRKWSPDKVRSKLVPQLVRTADVISRSLNGRGRGRF
jgi:DNA-binding IclR family transcriptional regulator